MDILTPIAVEALHLATLLCQYGYFFPVGDAKTLHVKDDSSLYRFQVSHFSSSAIKLKSQASLRLSMGLISERLACERGMCNAYEKLSRNRQSRVGSDIALDLSG